MGLLVERYNHTGGEWSCFCEVPMPTALFEGASRRIDFLAVRNWKPQIAVAVEIKVRRSDWLKELEDAGKAHAAIRQVNEFYVAAPAGVIKKEEVPVGWGCFTAQVGGLRKVVRPRRDPDRKLTEVLLRYLLRRSSLNVPHPKLFKHAGRDLTSEDLVDLIGTVYDDRQQAWLKYQVRHAIEDKLRQNKTWVLGQWVRQRFGGVYTSNDEIMAFLQTIERGAAGKKAEGVYDVEAAARQLRRYSKALENEARRLEKILNPGKVRNLPG
jgi:hypothetical protein